MIEIEKLEELSTHLTTKKISGLAFQALDLSTITSTLLKKEITDCLFLGCVIPEVLLDHIYKTNYIFPTLDLPYHAYPSKLYTRETLYNGFDSKRPKSYNKTLDKVIYDHYISTGKEAQNIKETLARRLHDHSISDALYDYLSNYEDTQIIAIMGGHGLSRADKTYYKVASIAKKLTEKGFLLVSGGGPGAMEATHVGAWFAGKKMKTMKAAIEHLSAAPLYNDKNWLKTAFEVLEKYPTSNYESVGIPTWLYGHEPPTPFATHIAKYFANSVREEGLLAIAKGGVVFAPGSAGTMQEIFQDIAQNHYESYEFASPMVFLDKLYWSYDRPIYPLLELLKLRGDLDHLDLGIYNSVSDIIKHIQSFRKSKIGIKKE